MNIKPTIGRRVWYWPSAQDRGETEHPPQTRIQQGDRTQACDAGIGAQGLESLAINVGGVDTK